MQFRKRDFEVSIEVNHLDPERAIEVAAAICRARPSRLNNDIEIEIGHTADQHIHNTVQVTATEAFGHSRCEPSIQGHRRPKQTRSPI